MVHVYKPKGVCSREMAVEVDENGIVQSCVIKGGCPGNLLGISRIVIGMKAEDVIVRPQGYFLPRSALLCAGRGYGCCQVNPDFIGSCPFGWEFFLF